MWKHVGINSGQVVIQAEKLAGLILNIEEKNSEDMEIILDPTLKLKMVLSFLIKMYADHGSEPIEQLRLTRMQDPVLSTISHLNDMERTEVEGGSESDLSVLLQKAQAKFEILRIVSCYNTMNVQLGMYKIMNDCFLSSNDARRNMLTQGVVLWYTQLDKKEGPDSYKLHSISLSELAPTRKVFEELNKTENKVFEERLITFLNQFVGMLNLESVPFEETSETSESTKSTYVSGSFHFWGGVGMIIPPKVEVVVSFTQIYPSLFVKKKNANNEIFIEESPWNLNWETNDKNFFTINGETLTKIEGGDLEVEPDSPEADGNLEKGDESKDIEDYSFKIKDKDLFCLNVATTFYNGFGDQQSGSLSKDRFSEAVVDLNQLLGQAKYQDLDLQVQEALAKCSVVLQMPYIAPQADMLVYVSFADDDKGTDNILMSSCC